MNRREEREGVQGKKKGVMSLVIKRRGHKEKDERRGQVLSFA